MDIDIDSLNAYREILRQREAEERKRQQRRGRIDNTKEGKQYWPSEDAPIVWCHAKDSEDFWKAINNFAQYAYDYASPEIIPRYPSKYDSRGYAALVFKLLAEKYNNSEFRFEFIEKD
jgi:hypothetical protein